MYIKMKLVLLWKKHDIFKSKCHINSIKLSFLIQNDGCLMIKQNVFNYNTKCVDSSSVSHWTNLKIYFLVFNECAIKEKMYHSLGIFLLKKCQS
jgi:hypothetical protein